MRRAANVLSSGLVRAMRRDRLKRAQVQIERRALDYAVATFARPIQGASRRPRFEYLWPLAMSTLTGK